MPNCSKSARILWIAACGFSVFSAVRCQAEPKRSPQIAAPKQALSSSTAQTDSKILSMMPEDFEQWLIANTEALYKPDYRPLVAEKAVFLRLSKGLYVTDKSMMQLILAWRIAENGFSGGTHFPESFRVIDALMKYTYDRPVLLAALHTRKAELYGGTEDRLSAAKEFQAASDLLIQEEATLDHQHLENLVNAGDEYLFLGDKQSALPIFQYAWDTMQVLRHGVKVDSVVEKRAGMGLIDCQRDNIPALKKIFTYHFGVYEDLKPVIEGVIRDTQESYKAQPVPQK